MSSMEPLVVVGAGQAGAELALAARQAGWPGPVVLLGSEAAWPYQRPPLSKGYLQGTASRDSLQLRAPSAYEAAQVTVVTGVNVQRIDRAQRRIHADDGRDWHYGKLALCLGGRARPFLCEGLTAGEPVPNLRYLRTMDDADAIGAALAPGKRLVIVGAGYVGLELAASATKTGAAVTVLEAMPRVLARVTGPEVSAFYESAHRDAGVRLLTGFSVQRAERGADGAIATLIGSGGERIEADLVVAGVGMLPNIELAQAAGLAIDGGIVVDAQARTSDPDIFAAGDCTVHDSRLYGRRLRLESVPNAVDQARAAAAALCAKPAPAAAVPWFWSDQYDLKLQSVGLSQGYDQCVLRGDPATRKFVAFYLSHGALIAADAVNRPADFMQAKRLVAARARPAPKDLSDESMALKSLVEGEKAGA